jgi:hypothetical protein
MDNTPPGGHPIDRARFDYQISAEGIPMPDRTIEQERHS